MRVTIASPRNYTTSHALTFLIENEAFPSYFTVWAENDFIKGRSWCNNSKSKTILKNLFRLITSYM